jgi:hypothetical protein
MTAPVLPINAVRDVRRMLQTAIGVSTSPFTLTDQVQDWGGERWEYEIDLASLDLSQGKRLSAFFASLGGMRTPFLLADPSIKNPSGLGTPLVNGAGQSGNSLVTDGWSATGMATGDFFSLGTDVSTRLYQLTSDVVPAGGAATLNFVPRLRSSPADNAALTVVSPPVLLRLTSPVPTGIALADIYQFTISAREAI